LIHPGRHNRPHTVLKAFEFLEFWLVNVDEEFVKIFVGCLLEPFEFAVLFGDFVHLTEEAFHAVSVTAARSKGSAFRGVDTEAASICSKPCMQLAAAWLNPATSA